jgi:hypothetical protein
MPCEALSKNGGGEGGLFVSHNIMLDAGLTSWSANFTGVDQGFVSEGGGTESGQGSVVVACSTTDQHEGSQHPVQAGSW